MKTSMGMTDMYILIIIPYSIENIKYYLYLYSHRINVKKFRQNKYGFGQYLRKQICFSSIRM